MSFTPPWISWPAMRAACCVVLSLTAFTTQAVTIEMVTVGNPGNTADPATGGLYGAVSYEYRIGKYEVTIAQYAEFLNAVATSDPYGLYDPLMGSNPEIAGISQSGTTGSFSYSVVSPAGVTPSGASSPGNRFVLAGLGLAGIVLIRSRSSLDPPGRLSRYPAVGPRKRS